jgi:hypothetical protein
MSPSVCAILGVTCMHKRHPKRCRDGQDVQIDCRDLACCIFLLVDVFFMVLVRLFSYFTSSICFLVLVKHLVFVRLFPYFMLLTK